MIPVVITVGGNVLNTWTEMTLQRSKDKLTGSLNVSIFAGAMPSIPLVRAAKAGAEIQVYIAGQLAFFGSIDRRRGTGTRKGDSDTSGGSDDTSKEHGEASSSVNIGPNEYTIKLSARGKTKRLIDSSHQHPTTNMLKPTTREVVEKLVQPWNIPIEWKGEVIKLDKQRFRDGSRVVDELHRVAQEYCYFMYETRDGKLRVTDGVGQQDGGTGDPLILGQNILTFSAEQSEDEARSKIKVKGQRSKKEEWGEKAVLKTFKEVRDQNVKDNAPETVQHYGDADDKALERRARFEANKRNSESKKITIEVFHVQTPSGAPWDIGNTHYVEVPPEGIFNMFECTELTYRVDADKELKTVLTLSPPPSGSAGSGMSGGFGLSGLNMNMGSARRSQAGIEIVSNQFPDPWVPPMLAELPLMTLVQAATQAVTELATVQRTPPLELPPWFGEITS